MIKNITFYYPSHNIGGAQILFLRLANSFAENSSFKISVIDFNDGYIKKNSITHAIEFIEYEKDKKYHLRDDTMIITPISKILECTNKVYSNNGKFLFWCIHPENLIFILKGASLLKRIGLPSSTLIKIISFKKYMEIRKNLLHFMRKNEVFFMDGATKSQTLAFYNIDEKELCTNYLPIPIPEIKSQYIEARNIFNICWIGRLDKDKIFSLIYILTALNNITIKNKIKIKIIGDGDCAHMIKTQKFLNLEISKVGFIENSQLHNELVNWNTGLVVGMGTSVLEAAIRKIPAMIIDPSHQKIKSNYVPKWLFQAENYTLGDYNKHQSQKKHTSFEIMFKEYLTNSNEIAEKCYLYSKKHYSMEKIMNQIIIVANNESY